MSNYIRNKEHEHKRKDRNHTWSRDYTGFPKKTKLARIYNGSSLRANAYAFSKNRRKV